jgi:hypothetical protein
MKEKDTMVMVRLEDLAKVVDYLYHDEEKDYGRPESGPANHIFLNVNRLARAAFPGGRCVTCLIPK